MKKILLLSLTSLLLSGAFAKKVKFAVDMTGIIINATGMHVSGDFQTAAGFPGGDWQSNTTPLTQEGSTNIYSIIVEIPAFTKYEYKFVNGDQFYDAEFVPEQSRVGYNFNDNRWIYIDSLANDTTFAGAIMFAANAPAGLTLLRVLVDMQNEPSISPAGVHVAGNFQGWNPASTILYSFGSDVYEIISYVTAGTYEYKYYNGNTASTVEIVPIACSSTNGNREIQVLSDTVLTAVCFSGCSMCNPLFVSEQHSSVKYNLFPNPAKNYTVLRLPPDGNCSVVISDVTGRTIREYSNFSGEQMRIEKGNLRNGIYFVTVSNNGNVTETRKLIFD